MTAAITVDAVTVRYGEVTALEDVSLSIRSGAVTGLIGMNGSGKSTLFTALAGAVTPASGKILLHGETPRAARQRRMIGYVPQSDAVDWSFPLSVGEVVMTGRYGGLGLTRRPRKEDRIAVAEALERVELTDLADRQIGRLSGGQRKRAFVARGLAQQARIVLLDEPFAGVDKRSEAMIVRLLRELAADGHTVLVSTHDLHALPALADDAILLRRRVIVQGTVSDALRPENLSRAFGWDVLSSTEEHP